MDHLAVLRLHFADRHLPACGGRSLQHLPRGRAATAHRHEEVPRAARTVGVLVPVALLVARRLHDTHARPVGFEFVGDDHRHAGAHALAHLRTMTDDADDAVLADGDKHEWAVDPTVRHAIRSVLGRVRGAQRGGESDGEHQPAERGSLEKLSPAHIGNHQRGFGRCHIQRQCLGQIERCIHVVAPFSPAACLIAARIRPYVPQRQMLPFIAVSISASVGLGFCLSSAVADMICPDWQ